MKVKELTNKTSLTFMYAKIIKILILALIPILVSCSSKSKQHRELNTYSLKVKQCLDQYENKNIDVAESALKRIISLNRECKKKCYDLKYEFDMELGFTYIRLGVLKKQKNEQEAADHCFHIGYYFCSKGAGFDKKELQKSIDFVESLDKENFNLLWKKK